MKKQQIFKLVFASVLAALALICFTFLKIEVPIGDGTGKIYIGHTFVMLAGLMLGPWYGAAVGAIGLTLSDILAGYATSAIPTFIAKALLGFSVGAVAHYLLKINKSSNQKQFMAKCIVACAAGAVVNVATEPFIRYFFKVWFLGYEHNVALASSIACAVSMTISGIVSVIIAAVLYRATFAVRKKYILQ